MWAKVASDWWCHAKVKDLSLGARGLWISALTWSCAQSIDEVPAAFLPMVQATTEHADELVDAGLWTETDDGWRIIDWGLISPPRRRRNIPRSTRQEVYERDGNRCLACSVTSDLTLDHIIPYSKGGPDTLENLRTLCRPCNSSKGDQTPEEWGA